MLENKIVRIHGGRKTLATHFELLLLYFDLVDESTALVSSWIVFFPILKYVSVKLNSESVFFHLYISYYVRLLITE